MNDIDYKALLSAYQQKSFDLFNQVVALESRLTNSNQIIESWRNTGGNLTLELEKKTNELEKKNKRTNKNTEDFSNSTIQ